MSGSVTYEMTLTETVRVVDKHVGFIRYPEGFKLYLSECDAHYVAFSTDYKVDKLMDADIEFESRLMTRTIPTMGAETVRYGDTVKHTVVLSNVDKASNSGDGLFGKKYTWNRIDSVSGFKSYLNKQNIPMTEATTAALDGTEWVFNFYETPYSEITVSGNNVITRTFVSNVTLMRLKFDMNGEIYNLGVVDNKQSGDDKPDNEPPIPWYELVFNFFVKCWEFIKTYWKWFLLALIVLLVLALTVKIFKWIFSK
ncbi:MAG: hypothetical protein NC131_15730 [Roseburia sp.]|nr:hypothetical protein [Roseburia sp.]